MLLIFGLFVWVLKHIQVTSCQSVTSTVKKSQHSIRILTNPWHCHKVLNRSLFSTGAFVLMTYRGDKWFVHFLYCLWLTWRVTVSHREGTRHCLLHLLFCRGSAYRSQLSRQSSSSQRCRPIIPFYCWFCHDSSPPPPSPLSPLFN